MVAEVQKLAADPHAVPSTERCDREIAPMACGVQQITRNAVGCRGERGTPVPLSVRGITASRQCQKMRSGDRTYLQPIRRSALPSPHGVRRAAHRAGPR